jgi:hypothetical protein
VEEQVPVDLSSLGPLGDPIGEDNGESEGVYPLVRTPAQLLKKYKPHCANKEDAARLDWVIERATLASAADRAMLKAKCCWPLDRVTDGVRPAYGVLLPRAPAKFQTTLRLNGDNTKDIQLEVDWLASEPKKCERRGIPVPTFEERLLICTDIVAVADFLDRHDVVYGDWSYANAFWSPFDHSGYVIDIDGCGYRTRKSVATQNWTDPRLPAGKPADSLTDRYGVALLLARCLTGVRDIEPALADLRQVAGQHGAAELATLVENSVMAGVREERPPVGTLLTALRHAQAGLSNPVLQPVPNRPDSGVVGWRKPGSSSSAVGPRTSPPNERPAPLATPSRPQQVRSRPAAVGQPPPSPPPTSGVPIWVWLTLLAVLLLVLLLLA